MGKETQQIAVNLLNDGTELVGDLTASTDLRIDGIIKGNIKTSGKVVLGPTARIEGTIESPEVDIIGSLIGDVTSSGSVTLREKSVVKGKIHAAFLSVESGAVFNGDCTITREASHK